MLYFLLKISKLKKLEECDRQFLCSDGYKLDVIVKSETPNTGMNDELKEKVLTKRYRTETNALDLSAFYLDPGNTGNLYNI